MCDSMRNSTTSTLQAAITPNDTPILTSVDPRQTSTSHAAARWPTIEIFRPLESCLTSKDYFALENFLIVLTERRSREAEYLARLIRTKLADARIVLSEDVSADVAIINSRVTYSINDSPAETRSLILGESSPVPNFNLPIFTLLGIGLLGMRTGQTGPWTDHSRNIGKLVLLRVDYQPQGNRQASQTASFPHELKE